MSDIVDRLRDRDSVVMSGLFHAIPTMLDAASEIERLRVALRDVMNASNDPYSVAKTALAISSGEGNGK